MQFNKFLDYFLNFFNFYVNFMSFSNIAFIEFLKVRIKNELPGFNSHLKMAMKMNKRLFRKFIPTPNAKKSSVLILLSGNDNLQVLLTLRSSQLKHHNNQISFPGGRNENDESAIEAAIRETHEETDIKITPNEIIGSLSDFFVPPSNSLITPIIAYSKELAPFKANPDEVEEIFTVELHKFVENDILKTTMVNVDGFDVEAPYWDVHPNVPLWGATSMIISELIDLYKEWLDTNKY